MKRIILAAVALMAVGGMTSAANAQAVKPPMSPELQKIVDGAKAEKVLLSSTNPLVFGGQANLDGAKAWIKENFGVDIDFNVTNGGPFGIVGAKIATEFRANQPSSVDIWTAGIAQYDPLLKLNMFTEVPWQKLWPQRIVPQQIGADGYSIGISTGTPGVLYNIATGSDFAQVKMIDDLLKPQYKGRFGTTAFVNGFDAMSAKGWEGEAKMADYIPKLGKQAQGVLNCGGQDRVASGEFQALVIDCAGTWQNTLKFRGQGVLDNRIIKDMAQRRYAYLTIMKNAEHPNAGILFTLFMLSHEGQEKVMWDYFGQDDDDLSDSHMHQAVQQLQAQNIKTIDVTMDWWRSHPGIEKENIDLAKLVAGH